MKCTLCFYELNDSIDTGYYDCSHCRAIVKDPALMPPETEEKARYETHNNDVYDSRYQKFTMPVTRFVLDHFTPDHKGLDFGSGTGPVISKMLEDKGYTIDQYDPYFAPFPGKLKKKYHYIVACEVIEHFYAPGKEFDRLFDMLLPGGMLIAMTLVYDDQRMDFRKWGYRYDPTHVIFYRRDTIRYIASRYGVHLQHMDDRLIVFQKVFQGSLHRIS